MVNNKCVVCGDPLSFAKVDLREDVSVCLTCFYDKSIPDAPSRQVNVMGVEIKRQQAIDKRVKDILNEVDLKNFKSEYKKISEADLSSRDKKLELSILINEVTTKFDVPLITSDHYRKKHGDIMELVDDISVSLVEINKKLM
jgi:hypothetical protein